MTERAPAPAPPRVPVADGRTLWAARLQRFGRGGSITALLVIAALWMHELFVDPEIRQGWKLKVLMVLIPLGVLASIALGVAWMLERPRRERQ
ncbi:MAG: hypothetical protein ACKODH_17125 [Limisphaerales bacterium]